MSRRNYKPEWDMGNGWNQVKPEWQDWEKAVDKTVTLAELKEMWCPASGSRITIDMSHVLDGLTFSLEVAAKEYKKVGDAVKKRKPTFLRANIQYASGIPVPGDQSVVTGNWCEKKTWTSAVKLILNEIIPAYENADSQSMCMWSVVHRDGIKLPGLQESSQQEKS